MEDEIKIAPHDSVQTHSVQNDANSEISERFGHFKRQEAESINPSAINQEIGRKKGFHNVPSIKSQLE